MTFHQLHKQGTARLRTTALTAKDIPTGLRMQTEGERKRGRALLNRLRSEFPYDLPMPRFCCGRYYRHCFYQAALISSYQTSRRAFLSQAAVLLVHASALIVYFG